MKESEFVNQLCEKLSPFFNIEKEVRGYYRFAGVMKKPIIMGKNNRIDLVLTHKIEKDLIFGIECKRIDYKKGKDLGAFINQAGEYADTKFYCGRIPILVYPSITGNYINEASGKHDYSHPHNNVTSALFTLKGIGEVKEFTKDTIDKIDFIINNVKIWSLRDNLESYSLQRYKKVTGQIEDRLEKNRGYPQLF